MPEASVEAIKAQVKAELVERMMARGIGDPRMLLSVSNGRLHPTVKRFLEDRALQLREIEKARVVQAAMTAASKLQVKMRDTIIQGDFREAYAGFSRSQMQYGIGILRFPYYQRRVVLADKQSYKGKPRRVERVVPTFTDVSPWNFFPTNDGRTVAECTAALEYREITKTALVGLANDSRYNKDAILAVLDTYSFTARTWLFAEGASTESEYGQDSSYWGPEEVIAVLHHEGLVTGKDLQDYGLTGYEATQVYEVRAEVCGGRAIRVEVNDPTKDLPRSYTSPSSRTWATGCGMRWACQRSCTTADRINTLLRAVEDNVDWAMRPPRMTNPEALQNRRGHAHPPRRQLPDQRHARPGTVRPRSARSGGRPRSTRSCGRSSCRWCRQVDAELGVPDLADMTTFGRGSWAS